MIENLEERAEQAAREVENAHREAEDGRRLLDGAKG
jgi:hypothetical protein